MLFDTYVGKIFTCFFFMYKNKILIYAVERKPFWQQVFK